MLSALATLCSASFLICDFLHSLHFLTGCFPPFCAIISSYTDSLSFKTALRPLAFPCGAGSGWLGGYVMDWGWPQVSGHPGLGRGLLRGMVVSHRWHWLPPVLTFMLLCSEHHVRALCGLMSSWREKYQFDWGGFVWRCWLCEPFTPLAVWDPTSHQIPCLGRWSYGIQWWMASGPLAKEQDAHLRASGGQSSH